MQKERIANYIGEVSLSIVDAMSRIDANSKGILFIVDELGKLVGSLTDGDIRRWILKSGDIKKSVSFAMNSHPKYRYIGNAGDLTNFMLNNSITAVPLLDCEKSIVDIFFLNEDSIFDGCGNSLNGVSVVIMAGGRGTRLYPYTKILPKPLIPIGDTPIVERIINHFCEFGITNFYMSVNYKKGMIRSYFDDIDSNYSIEYIEEVKPLGTGGSLKLINDSLDKPFFVTNCDTIVLADYSNVYHHHIESGNDITVVSALKNFQIPYGVLKTGNDGELVNMEEKPKLSYFINTGMYIVNPSVLELIPDGVVFHMTNLVEKVMENNGKVGTYPVSEDSFLDMGEMDEMKRMEEKLGV